MKLLEFGLVDCRNRTFVLVTHLAAQQASAGTRRRMAVGHSNEKSSRWRALAFEAYRPPGMARLVAKHWENGTDYPRQVYPGQRRVVDRGFSGHGQCRRSRYLPGSIPTSPGSPGLSSSRFPTGTGDYGSGRYSFRRRVTRRKRNRFPRDLAALLEGTMDYPSSPGFENSSMGTLWSFRHSKAERSYHRRLSDGRISGS